MKKILVEMLLAAEACKGQVALFRKTFPDGCPVSAAGLRKAQAAGLEVLWAEKLLPPSARAAYDKVCDSALAEYDKVRAAAWDEYSKVRAAAWAEYSKVRASAWAEFDKVRALAWAEYDKVCAKELLRLLKTV